MRTCRQNRQSQTQATQVHQCRRPRTQSLQIRTLQTHIGPRGPAGRMFRVRKPPARPVRLPALGLPLVSPAVSWRLPWQTARGPGPPRLLRADRLATACAACVQDLASGLGGHACAKTVAALANQVARLKGAFHRSGSVSVARLDQWSARVGNLEARSLGGRSG